MRRDKWAPTSSSYLCGEQFCDSDYSYPTSLPHSNALSKRYLRKDAVPSKFKFPPHLQKKPTKDRNPKKRMIESQDSHPSVCPPKTITRQDHTYGTFHVKSSRPLNHPSQNFIIFCPCKDTLYLRITGKF